MSNWQRLLEVHNCIITGIRIYILFRLELNVKNQDRDKLFKSQNLPSMEINLFPVLAGIK